MTAATAHPPTATPASAEVPRAHSWREWLQAEVPLPAVAHHGRVLLISYEFPPTGGSGVHRPARLARYLGDFGWQVVVLTAGHDRFLWRDDSLCQTIPSTCRIHPVPGFEPACLAARLASLPGALLPRSASRWLEDRLYWRLIKLTAAAGWRNGEHLWIGPAAAAARRLHRHRPFDALISTGPPHFAHRVALRVQQATGLPWLADLRDPLVSDFSRSTAISPDVRALQRLERTILRRAALVITTCPALADDLRTRCPHRRADTIRAITNGFDRADLRAALSAPATSSPPLPLSLSPDPAPNRQIACIGPGPRPLASGPSSCTLVAAGSLYGRREIERLVAPLRSVLDRHSEWRHRVRLVLAGSIDAQQRRHWEQHRPEWLTLVGYLDHAAALRLAASAACAIVMVPDCAHGRLSIPGKTFELIALPTHILGLVPEDGDTADILRAAGAATIAPLESADRVARAFEQIITDFFADRLPIGRDWPALNRYDRRVIAATFAHGLNQIRRRPA